MISVNSKIALSTLLPAGLDQDFQKVRITGRGLITQSGGNMVSFISFALIKGGSPMHMFPIFTFIFCKHILQGTRYYLRFRILFLGVHNL